VSWLDRRSKHGRVVRFVAAVVLGLLCAQALKALGVPRELSAIPIGRSQVTRFTAGLQPLGLRPKHFALLNLIDLNEGTSQQQLAKRLSLEPSGLVKTIDELQQQGIVERRQARTIAAATP